MACHRRYCQQTACICHFKVKIKIIIRVQSMTITCLVAHNTQFSYDNLRLADFI